MGYRTINLKSYVEFAMAPFIITLLPPRDVACHDLLGA